jgi:uncharacterized membrane protein YqiK
LPLVAGKQAELERQYQAASDTEARRIVANAVAERHAADEAELAREAAAALQAEAQRPLAERERDASRQQLLSEARCTFRSRRWPHFPKVISLPELHRSTAKPLDEAYGERVGQLPSQPTDFSYSTLGGSHNRSPLEAVSASDRTTMRERDLL